MAAAAMEEEEVDKSGSRKDLCRMLDDLALIVFPLACVVFNIFYWAYFMSVH
jgi:hypothetical protein